MHSKWKRDHSFIIAASILEEELTLRGLAAEIESQEAAPKYDEMRSTKGDPDPNQNYLQLRNKRKKEAVDVK